MEKRLENYKLSEEEIAKIDKMHKEAFEKVQKDALGNVIENDSIIDKYIVSSNQPKFVLNYKSKFDEYGFEIED